MLVSSFLLPIAIPMQLCIVEQYKGRVVQIRTKSSNDTRPTFLSGAHPLLAPSLTDFLEKSSLLILSL